MRPDVPEVSFGGDLDAVLRAATQSLKIMLWEKEQSRGFKEILAGLNSTPDSVALLIGPEGGFSANEAQRAEAAGFIPVTVGRRIVRTETAGLLAVTILQFCWGDLG
jgi:16S rRNA (uracil1498-N3)-methyltransferase